MTHPFSKVLRENPMALRVKDGRPMHLFGADELDRLYETAAELERVREINSVLLRALNDVRTDGEWIDVEGRMRWCLTSPLYYRLDELCAKHARAETSSV